MQITSAAAWHALAGGVLIGAGSAMLLLLNGRVAGVSGILGRVVHPEAGELGWRIAFLAGLSLPAWLLGVQVTLFPQDWRLAILAGLLVGVGTQVGSGCTSGHGVCGLANLSRRSLAATFTFMTAAVVTVLLVRHAFP